MSQGFDHDRLNYICTAVNFDSMLHSRHVQKFLVLLCAKNNILMDTQDRKRKVSSTAVKI